MQIKVNVEADIFSFFMFLCYNGYYFVKEGQDVCNVYTGQGLLFCIGSDGKQIRKSGEEAICIGSDGKQIRKSDEEAICIGLNGKRRGSE